MIRDRCLGCDKHTPSLPKMLLAIPKAECSPSTLSPKPPLPTVPGAESAHSPWLGSYCREPGVPYMGQALVEARDRAWEGVGQSYRQPLLA